MKNNKRSFVFRFAGTAAFAVLAASLMLISVGAAGFSKTNTYADGQFADVPAAEWYAAEVKSTYELGLMNGTGGGLFAPNGNVTVAEAITMASRAASINAGETIAASNGEWYQMYVDYAVSKGFVKEGQFDNYNRPAKRYEVASLFENAMPEGYFAAKNAVDRIPDVSESLSYQADLLNLYRAGVVMGSDSYGNFKPEDNITRAEAAAIINRVALPENRLAKTLDKISRDDAYTLVYNTSYVGSKEGINSGWRLDNRGGRPRTTLENNYGTLTDMSTAEGTAMIREFNKITTGVVTLDTSVTLGGGFDGFSLEYRNEADEPVYKLVTDQGAWKVLGADGTYTTIMENAEGVSNFTFKITVDVDNNRSTTVINKVDCGTHPLATTGEATNLLNFRFATGEESTAVAALKTIRISVNYAVYNDFTWHNDGTLPYDWTGYGAVSEGGFLKISEGGVASKYFSPVSGTVIANTEVNLKQGETVGVELKSGAKSVVKFTSDDKNFYANGVKVYENYVQNLWYRIRLEVKTLENKAVIWVNGIRQAEVDLAEKTTSVDSITLSNMSPTVVSFDSVSVFEKIYHEDYVPVPVKPAGEEKYTVGMNICSLWRNGTHFGWATITPYPDAEPVLGYYDEGVVESADWEIKYMVEHGIDFQAFCWYADNVSAPIKAPRNEAQLYDAYKYAEYSDMMKYCIIWEAANGGIPKNFDAFKQYYVPYLIEYFFKDERYMTIDNQLVMCMFGPNSLSTNLGGEDKVREAFDYMEEEVRKLGFDGIIYLACGSSSDSYASMGFDGSYAYNWGNEGYKFEVNQSKVLSSAKNLSMYTVPTISVGFNSIPWHGIRYPMMSVEDYRKSHLWVRDEYLPDYAEDGTWQENFVMLSTWNEYGEGTYIMPSAGNGGFGYLDVLREVYTDEKADESLNTVPTEAQKARITHLYPQYRRLLRKNGEYVYEVDESKLETVYTIDYSNKAGKNITNTKTYAYTENGLEGRVEGDTLIVTSGLKIDASQVSHLRLRMDVPEGTSCQIYFQTDKDKSWNASKGVKFTASEGGLTDHLIDMSQATTWKDTIISLRVDPGHTTTGVIGNDFLIVSVDFLTEPEKVSKIMYINDQIVSMQLYPEKSQTGDYLVAFDPKVALDYRLNALHTWDAADKQLTLELNHHNVIYTAGSSKYVLDGKEKDLGYELYMVDGLPMIPINKLCEDVGYECSVNESNEVVVYTAQRAYFEELASRVPGQWEFNTPGDTEGWSSSFMSLFTADGYMACESATTSSDPTIVLGDEVNLTAARYNKFEVRVRYEYAQERQHTITMYFTTDAQGTMKESVTIKAPLKSNNSNGEWEVYTVDLSTVPDWRGTIKKLRFDPFNTTGKMDIDYIRFIEDENYDPDAPAKFDFRNGDAENGVSPFFSNNATLSIVDDPEKEGNKVFLLKSKSGKNWTYFRQEVAYGAGKTYKYEFDIKIAGIGDDIEGSDPDFVADVFVNFRFTDGSTIDHKASSLKAAVKDGWVHHSGEYTVKDTSVRGADQFAVYVNPVGNISVNYYIDNVVVTEVE